jgi:TolB-like protein/tetratricopeptide (TPR) repeat protein
MTARRVSPPGARTVPPDDLLESWKQIAEYLRRDVRTVIRWEKTRGLPVHRIPGGSRRAVYGRKSELETWRTQAISAREPTAPCRPSIAVLPFANLSPDKDTEYFGDGLADEILTLLARVPGLLVTARTSSFAFRGQEKDVRRIGAALGVSTLLEGSVRQADDRLRVTVQLIDTRDGYHIWAEQFERSAADVFALQDEIAHGVVRTLQVRLGSGSGDPIAVRHQPSREAHDLYLKGRHFLAGRVQIPRAIECFEASASLDPDYAAAHLGVADVIMTLALWGHMPPAPAFGRAKAAVHRALEIDESLPGAHMALGSLRLLADWDWKGARVHFERADGRLPAPSGPFGMGFYYMLDGRPRDTLRYLREMLARDPLSAAQRTQAAAGHIALGAREAATALLEEALDLDNRMPMAKLWLGFCRGVEGRYEEAVRWLEAASAGGLALAYSYLVSVLLRAGSSDRALATHRQLESLSESRYVSPFCLALSHGALGDSDRCRHLLARAAEVRCPLLTLSVVGPGYLALAPEEVTGWVQAQKPLLGIR